MTEEVEPRAWYVAYGSNIDHARFARYLDTDPTDVRVSGRLRWVTISHQLYFAGTSKTWGGPVAFIALPTDPETTTIGLGRLLSMREIEIVARKENGAPLRSPVLPKTLPAVGKWTQLDVPTDDIKGKYNALLRLPDVEGLPALTLTTLRSLPLGVPTAEYRQLIELAADGRMTLSAHQPTGLNTEYLPASAVNADIQLTPGGSPGMRAITLPGSMRPDGESMMLGEVSFGDKGISTWIQFDDKLDEREARAPANLVRELGLHPDGIARVSFDRPTHFRLLGGRAGDIPDSDVIFMSRADAARFDGWALLITERACGPVRVKVRDHVPLGAVRLAYALRVLVAIAKDPDGRLPGHVALQPLPMTSRFGRAVRGAARWFGEIAIGAPPLALKMTEALVGDDGKPVIRVDTTALDFLGCSSGDTVIVSWARRTCRARVLLQTDVTRERMHAQLSESTGEQTRASTGDINARLGSPAHLQAWVSSSVRHRLDVPPDSIIRVRRSIARTIAKHSALLSLPVAGLIFAALAIPDLRMIALLAIAPVIVLSLLPIRMPRR